MKPRTKTLIVAGLFAGVLGATAVIGYDAAEAHRGGDDGWKRMHHDHDHGYGRQGAERHHGYHDRGHDRFAAGRHRGMGRMLRMMEHFDGDGDGRISQAEIDTARRERLAEFDRDGNGTLSLEEYEALWLDAMRTRMVRGFQRHDRDGDGAVTPDEFTRRFSHTVLRFDRNGDEVLDRSDWEHRYRAPREDDDNDDRRGE